ncbi:hypothetical protein BDV37DRAFT_287305 [Aspergillus pseudonomiae]|uniref:Uncharacterized protein n=1 Tax=Aspergillus pseudonomiae TaxID=1506151 RepID=A0A5N7D030_9EURO|nr:uncharacterized protein BDV37DRAFT_287305 [Aspergillus pseudonomiae]KAE8399776.1 hypothetical protein BDV37DRAFT_287305 [Aspergillus pseudonomiae]
MRPGSSETDDAFMAPMYIESSIWYDDEGLESTENGLPGIGYSRSSIQLSGIPDTGYSTYDGDDISTNHPSRPGDTLENPITIDTSDHDNNIYPGSYSGDNNPIELDIASDRHSSCDTASVYTRGPGSTHESPVQVENLVDGKKPSTHFLRQQ